MCGLFGAVNILDCLFQGLEPFLLPLRLLHFHVRIQLRFEFHRTGSIGGRRDTLLYLSFSLSLSLSTPRPPKKKIQNLENLRLAQSCVAS